MIKIGILGDIGSGKSHVAKNFGHPVFNADLEVSKLYKKDKKLYNKLKKKKIDTILTREPGGTKSSELIRNLILKDYFAKDGKEKFDKYTDTLLYLAARNEHIKNKIKPALLKKKGCYL